MHKINKHNKQMKIISFNVKSSFDTKLYKLASAPDSLVSSDGGILEPPECSAETGPRAVVVVEGRKRRRVVEEKSA